MPEITNQRRPPPRSQATSAASTDATIAAAEDGIHVDELRDREIERLQSDDQAGQHPDERPEQPPGQAGDQRHERGTSPARSRVRASTSASQKPATRPTSRWLWTRSAYWTIRVGPERQHRDPHRRHAGVAVLIGPAKLAVEQAVGEAAGPPHPVVLVGGDDQVVREQPRRRATHEKSAPGQPRQSPSDRRPTPATRAVSRSGRA